MLSIKERNPNTIQNPGADTKVLFNDATDGKLKTKDSVGTIEEVALVDATAPKVYVALLTQTGTDAPVATVLQNTLGGTVVWSRNGTGEYYGTLLGAFTGTVPHIEYIYTGNDTAQYYYISKDTNNIISVISKDTPNIITVADNILKNAYIKIEVYP